MDKKLDKKKVIAMARHMIAEMAEILLSEFPGSERALVIGVLQQTSCDRKESKLLMAYFTPSHEDYGKKELVAKWL